MLLARAVRVPSLLLVFCQVQQERSYAYSTTSFVSQAGEDYGGPEGSLPVAFLFKRFLCLSDLFHRFVSAILFRRFISSICFSDFVSSIYFFDLFQRFCFVDLFLRFVSAISFRRFVSAICFFDLFQRFRFVD